MKFCALTWWLVVSVDLVFFGSCHRSLKPQKYNFNNTKINDVQQRWKLEKMAFHKGLKVMNDQGQLVEVTPDQTPPPGSGRRSSSKDIHFRLFTQTNPTEPHALSIDSDSGSKDSAIWNFFNKDKPTYFVTHGWMNSGDSDACVMVRDALLKKNDVNVVIIDWDVISHSFYGWAVLQLKNVSKKIFEIIKFLVETDRLDPDQTTLVGHSLGAHIMGMTGHLMGGTLAAIFGLDPALPYFTLAVSGDRLSEADAKHVQIIHTCAGLLGFDKAIGTADFYPDGGVKQKNCRLDVGGACSHSRAYEYYAESISSEEGFYGKRCNGPSDFEADNCDDDNVGRMGGLKPEKNVRGSYFLWTNPTEPFAQGTGSLRRKKMSEVPGSNKIGRKSVINLSGFLEKKFMKKRS